MARKETPSIGKPAAKTASLRTAPKTTLPLNPAAMPVGKTTAVKAAKTPVRNGAKAAPAKAKVAPTAVKQVTVTPKHLAAGLSESQGMAKRDAEVFATVLIDNLVGQVKDGAKVRIAGLGVIELKDRPARTARNPATGEPVQVEASRKIVFRPAKDLKEAIA